MMLLGMMAMLTVITSSHPAKASQDIAGVLAAASGMVERRPEGVREFSQITSGDKIFENDEIRTGPDGRIQILLMDETTFSIGADSNIIIDEFVYDASQKDGAIDVNIKQGVFRFISGRIAKASPQKMKVMAGNAVISIRGTEVIGTVENGQGKIVLLSGAIDITSSIPSCQNGGAGCMQTVTRPGFGVTLNDAGKVTAPTN